MKPLADLPVSDHWYGKPKRKLQKIGDYKSVRAYRMRRAVGRFHLLEKIVKQAGVFLVVIQRTFFAKLACWHAGFLQSCSRVCGFTAPCRRTDEDNEALC